MTGVVLAAGMARRLHPLTLQKPKCLLEVGGRTLLERTVDAQIVAGIDELVVVTGFCAEMIREFLIAHYPSLKITFIDNPDYEHNNNIFSLWLAMGVVRGRDFLLMDSDILCDPEAVKRVADAKETSLALNRHELGEEEMKIISDKNGCVAQISKTCSIAEAIGESMGIEKMTADYSEALYGELKQMIEQEGLDNVFYERAFERLIQQGHTFRIIDTTDLFSYEIDTPEDYERAKTLWNKN